MMSFIQFHRCWTRYFISHGNKFTGQNAENKMFLESLENNTEYNKERLYASFNKK